MAPVSLPSVVTAILPVGHVSHQGGFRAPYRSIEPALGSTGRVGWHRTMPISETDGSCGLGGQKMNRIAETRVLRGMNMRYDTVSASRHCLSIVKEKTRFSIKLHEEQTTQARHRSPMGPLTTGVRSWRRARAKTPDLCASCFDSSTSLEGASMGIPPCATGVVRVGACPEVDCKKGETASSRWSVLRSSCVEGWHPDSRRAMKGGTTCF